MDKRLKDNAINWGIAGPEIEHFIAAHDLPEDFSALVASYFLPLAKKLTEMVQEVKVLGVNGAQGTGKSTLSALLSILLEKAGIKTVVLSLDDFYLTKSERLSLAESIHPLLAVRGVPGTHDIPLALQTIQQLIELDADSSLPIPRFDKAVDDRCKPETFDQVSGPVDIIILEGWCIGASAQPASALTEPVNTLEEHQDANGQWRDYVNQQLAADYQSLFSMIDCLVMLKAPSFDAIKQWRWQQEQQLIRSRDGRGDGLMNQEQINQFIEYYERLSRHCLAELPARADIIFSMNDQHGIDAVSGRLSKGLGS